MSESTEGIRDAEGWIWEADPTFFRIPQIDLPFDLSIWGLLAAVLLMWLGWKRLTPAGDERPSPAVQGVLIGGSLILGQLLLYPFGGPVVETLGPIEARWYGFFFALSFLLGYLLTFKLMEDGGMPPPQIDRLVIFIVIGTIVFARLGHIVFYELDYYLRNPHLIPAIWRGGVASHGAAIGILLAMWAFVKQTPGTRFLWIADRVVPAVAIGACLIRIGNFFNSEILGTETDLPWAVVFAHIDMVPRHPSMLYESLSGLFVLVVVILLYHKFRKQPPEGALFGTFLVMLFTGRFLIEFTKLHHADFEPMLILNMGHWLSVPLVLFGVWLLLRKVDWSDNSDR